MDTLALVVFGLCLFVGAFFFVIVLTFVAEALTYHIEGRRK